MLDEGFAVTQDGARPDQTAALIGLAEKGYFTLELTVEGAGGHSSTPTRETPIGILAAAIAKLERKPNAGEDAAHDGADVRRADAGDIVRSAHRAGKPLAVRSAAHGLFLLARQYGSVGPHDDRTHVIQAGVKENVLPQSRNRTDQLSYPAGDTSVDILAHVDARSGPARSVRPVAPATEPSRESRSRARAFRRSRAPRARCFPMRS